MAKCEHGCDHNWAKDVLNSKVVICSKCLIEYIGIHTKTQTKLESFIEQVVNVGTGMILSFACMELVLAPLLGIGITFTQNIWTTIVLTILSVLRGYIWRRVFNKKLYRNWANWLRRFTS